MAANNYKNHNMTDPILARFLRLIAYNTQSDEYSTSVPSTPEQLTFARMLAQELEHIGLQQVNISPYGIVSAVLPANTDRPVMPIGFISHMDTAPDYSGEGIRAQVHADYQGEDIALSDEVTLSPSMFPQMLQYKGCTLITTDGSTLLGADDKAGITEIMCAMEYLIAHPHIEHGDIHIAFTPDEEIGCGVDHFNVPDFQARYAYTVDGGAEGELEYENFNAARADINIQGINVHPGSAKNVMVNSQDIAMELHHMLPPMEKPEYTCNREGFFHLCHMQGTVELTTMSYIIRDHNRQKFEQKKQLLQQCTDTLNSKYNNCITCHIEDQYYNMGEIIEKNYFMVELAETSMKEAGAVPIILPIRGGTDGARLSYMGLPCPNLFTGGHNFHGKYEFAVLESMHKACMTIVNICKNFALIKA